MIKTNRSIGDWGGTARPSMPAMVKRKSCCKCNNFTLILNIGKNKSLSPWEQSETAYVHQGECMVWICSSYRLNTDCGSRLLPQFNVNCLIQGYMCDKNVTKMQSLSPDISAKLWTMPYLAMMKNPFKIPVSRCGWLTKSTGSSLRTDTSEAKFSRFSFLTSKSEQFIFDPQCT